MNKTAAELIGYRSEILAKEFLTRRSDIGILDFKETGLDLYGTVYATAKDDVLGFMSFGVAVTGTASPLDDGKATRLANTKWNSRRPPGERTTYFLPVFGLLFSMEKDQGYYCWIAEPRLRLGMATPGLEMVYPLKCHSIDNKTLDEIVERIKSWYKAVASVIIVGHHGSG